MKLDICHLIYEKIAKDYTYDTVPVQFSGSALLQMLLCSRNVTTLRQVLNDLLTHPSAVEDLRLGV